MHLRAPLLAAQVKATAILLRESLPHTRETSWVLRLRGHGPDCALRFREDPARYCEGIPTTFEPAVATGVYDAAPARGSTISLPPLRGGNPHDLPLDVDCLEAGIPCDILEDHPPRMRLRVRGRVVSGVLRVDTEAGVACWEPETLPGRVLPVGGRLVSREAMLEAFTVPAEAAGKEVTFTDRYAALGIPAPEPDTVCGGHCEGTGWVPVWNTPTIPGVAAGDRATMPPETDPALLALWKAAEAEHPAEDGWHFVRCPACDGTGLKAEARTKAPPFTTEGYSPAGRADDNLAQDWRVVAACWAGHEAPGSKDRAKVLATAAAIVEELVRRERQFLTGKAKPLHETTTLRAVLRGSCRMVASVTHGEARELVTGRAGVLLMGRESAGLDGGFVGVCAGGRLYGYARFDRAAILERDSDVTDMESMTGVTLDLARESLGFREAPYYAYRVIDCLALDMPVDIAHDGGGRGVYPVAIREAATTERVAAASAPELLIMHRRVHEQWGTAVEDGRDHLRPDLERTHLVIEREMRRRGLEHRLSGDYLDESAAATGGLEQAAADIGSFLSRGLALPSPALAVTGVRRGARGEREVDLWVNAREGNRVGHAIADAVRGAVPPSWTVNLRFNADGEVPARLGAFAPVLVLEAKAAAREPGAVATTGMTAATAADAAASRRADAVSPGRAIFMPEPQQAAPAAGTAGVDAALSLLPESAYPILVQPMLDGLRVRLDKVGDSVTAYDRDGLELTLEAVPALREALRRHPHDFVAEAVIQVYTRQRGLSPGEVAEVLLAGKYDQAADKAATATITDMLWLDGRDLHGGSAGEAYEAAQNTQESKAIRVVRAVVAQDRPAAARVAQAMASVIASQGFVAKSAAAPYSLAGGTDPNRVEYRRERELQATVLAVESVPGHARPQRVYLLGLRDDRGVMVPCGRTATTAVRASAGDTLRVTAGGTTRMRDPETAETWYDMGRPRVIEAIQDRADSAAEAHAAARASGSTVEQVPMPGEYRRLLAAFCPTGKGGGQDNSCASKSGGTRGTKDLNVEQIVGMSRADIESRKHPSVRFDPKLNEEANYDSGVVTVGPKFFALPEDARRATVAHEIAHELDTRFNGDDWSNVIDAAQAGVFGPLRKDGTIDGINGQYKPGENAVETYSLMFEDDDALKERFPKAREFVARLANEKGMPLPDQVRKDYDLSEAREAFCPTGKDGGVDNSCPPSRKGGGDAKGGPAMRTANGNRKFKFNPTPPGYDAKKFVTGENGLPYEPMTDFPLTPEQKQAQKELGDYLGSDQAFDEYADHQETLGGKKLNGDLFRELHPGFKGDNDSRTLHTLSTHQPAGAMVKQQFAAMLDEPVTGGVMVMAGGGGSGKSTVLGQIDKDANAADIILDAVMSKESNKSKGGAFDVIDAAIASGRPVSYNYVHRPFEEAMVGVDQRFFKDGGGRYVPNEELVSAHIGAQETMLAVAARYGDPASKHFNPKVEIVVFNNSGQKAKGEKMESVLMSGPEYKASVAKFQKERYTAIYGSADDAKTALRAIAEDKLSKVNAKVKEVLAKSRR